MSALPAGRPLAACVAASAAFVVLRDVALLWVAPARQGAAAAALAFVLAAPAAYVVIRRGEAPPRGMAAAAGAVLGAAVAGVALLLQTR